MSAKIIAVTNMKGGVGKTTVSVGLAEMLAAGGEDAPGRKVLMIDLDAQANASFSLAGDSLLLELIQSGRTIDAFFEDRIVFGQDRRLEELVRYEVGALPDGPRPGMIALVASSPELRIVEREMIVFLSRRDKRLMEIERQVGAILKEELDGLRAKFDVIIFDCAPGISALTEAALRASDLVIVPTVPDFISNLGLEAFCKTVQWADPDNAAGGRPPWVLANRVRRTPTQLAILEEMRAEAAAEDAGFAMFRTEIGDRVEMENVTAWTGARLGFRAKYGADMVEVLAGLAKEVEGALDGR